MSNPQFKSQERPGFSMTFENGWTASVQWHAGAYCERKNPEYITDNKPAISSTAEIAAWDKDGKWYKFADNDEVKGYCTPDQVAVFLAMVKGF